MKLLFALDRVGGWVRAAGYLGHQGFAFDPARPFDSFLCNPDIVFCGNKVSFRQGSGGRALARYPRTRLVEVSALPPAADCPPDFAGGRVRPEFVCDVVVVGEYRSEVDEPLRQILGAGLHLKVFGRGPWPVAQCAGYVPAVDIADVYASARYTLDLGGDVGRTMTVRKAGGRPASVTQILAGEPVEDEPVITLAEQLQKILAGVEPCPI
jgi:hypothetical protein